jgi:hypothetical protein
MDYTVSSVTWISSFNILKYFHWFNSLGTFTLSSYNIYLAITMISMPSEFYAPLERVLILKLYSKSWFLSAFKYPLRLLILDTFTEADSDAV